MPPQSRVNAASLPTDTDGILAVKRFEVIADGACDALVLMFFENTRDEASRSAPWYDRQQRKLDGALREIERVLADHTYCHGERFSMADIAIGTLLRYLTVRWPSNPWRAQYPTLAVYSDRLESRPSFSATQPVPQVIRDRVA